MSLGGIGLRGSSKAQDQQDCAVRTLKGYAKELLSAHGKMIRTSIRAEGLRIRDMEARPEWTSRCAEVSGRVTNGYNIAKTGSTPTPTNSELLIARRDDDRARHKLALESRG